MDCYNTPSRVNTVSLERKDITITMMMEIIMPSTEITPLTRTRVASS